jgi:hypothetical protein
MAVQLMTHKRDPFKFFQSPYTFKKVLTYRRRKHQVLNEESSLAKPAAGGKRLNPFRELSSPLFIPCSPGFLLVMKLSLSERPRLGREIEHGKSILSVSGS